MNKKYLILGLLGIILILGLLKIRDKKNKGEILDEHLKPGERTAVIVDTNTGEVTTITRGDDAGDRPGSSILRRRQPQSPEIPPEVVKRTDGARNIRLSIDDKGNVTYTFRTWGFQFSPEAGTCYASGHPGVTLNDSFFFWRKHEALVGLRFALAGSKEIRPYVGYAYRPKWKYMSNTALVLGIDLDKAFVFGTSTQF